MRTRSRFLPWRLLLASLALASLALASARPTVVVSIHPLYDLVRQVVGEAGDVERMLPIGASPHVFDPTPRDVARVADADLVVTVGAIDAWLRDLLEAAGGDAVRLELLELDAMRAALEADFPDLKPDDARSVLAWNAHVWLDPRTMAVALPAIAEALAAVDPANAAGYAARAEALAADLRALDAELAATLAPVRGAPFVPFHDAWPYFAARYGLDLVVEIEPFPGREPSPAYLAMALGLIRESGAAAIFSEAQLNRRPAEVVADEAGVALFELDPIGGVAGREGYQELLRWNAAVLLEGLR
jgi:ABC-type Zn uptake system ZnuABC Zn-binding protein ZnuA